MGGAIGVDLGWFGQTSISRNTFYKNQSDYGGAVYFDDIPLLAEENTFVLNEAHHPTQFPAAVNLNFGATGDFRRNVFALTIGGWAVNVANGATATFDCNLFWRNDRGAYGGGSVGPTNLFADPRLCDATGDDLHVAIDSPCLPANNAGCGQIGALGEGCLEIVGVADPGNLSPTAANLQVTVASGRHGRVHIVVEGSASVEATLVEVKIVDVLGRLLHASTVPLSDHGAFIEWGGESRGRRAAPGVYFVQAQAGGEIASAKFVLLP